MVGMRLLRNILAFLLAFLLILLLFIPVLIVSGLFKHDKFLFSQSRLVIRTTLRLLGVKANVRGLDAVDFSVPQVVICNHLSNLDGPLLVSVLPVDPRVLIVPLLAFDRRGYRLGYGGGFYDRSFAYLLRHTRWLRPRLIGLAYDFQHQRRLPSQTWDVPLQAIATDQHLYLSR